MARAGWPMGGRGYDLAWAGDPGCRPPRPVPHVRAAAVASSCPQPSTPASHLRSHPLFTPLASLAVVWPPSSPSSHSPFPAVRRTFISPPPSSPTPAPLLPAPPGSHCRRHVPPPPATLVVLPQSHYCDRAAWALTAAGVPFTRAAHAIPTYLLFTQLPYGSRGTPILVRPPPPSTTPGAGVAPAPLLSSDAIVEWVASAVEPRLAAPAPTDVDLEARLSRRLGVHTRRWTYYHVLATPGMLARLSSAGLGAIEGAVYKVAIAVGAVDAYLRRGLAIDAAAAERSLAAVRELFEEVSARLVAQGVWGGGKGAEGAAAAAAGRRVYMGGDGSRLTTLDITWGALAAPVLFPESHYARVTGQPVQLAAMPAAYQRGVAELRATPAGEYGLWLMEHVRWSAGGGGNAKM